MKMWECKHSEIQAASQPQLDSQESQDSLSDEEYAQMQHLTQLAENLISCKWSGPDTGLEIPRRDGEKKPPCVCKLLESLTSERSLAQSSKD